MKYSKTAHQAGTSGFYLDEDANAPTDSVEVSESDVMVAINLPAGSTYDFDANGAMTYTLPSDAFLLSQAKAAQTASLSKQCQQAIYAGFTSSALGAAYTYPAKDTDQQNLTASVVSSLVPGLATGWTTPFWCADANGAWAFRPHTATQIQQVGTDGKAAILAAMQKNQQLADQVNAATTVADVQAVVWS